MYIASYSESGEFLGTITEEAARQLISSGRATVVRDKSGKTRRVYEVGSAAGPLKGTAKRQALGSYRGLPKYTYVEHFDNAPACHMLKRYNANTGQFQKWPEGKPT